MKTVLCFEGEELELREIPVGHKDLGVRKYNPSLAAQQSKSGRAYLSKIRKLEPYERFLYLIKERQRIHTEMFPKGITEAIKEFPLGHAYDDECVEAGLGTKPPWTDDPILQTVFVCNAYSRENDRISRYLLDNFTLPDADEKHVFLGTILLRWFNYIPTMQALINSQIPHSFGSGKLGKRGFIKGYWDRKGYLKLLLDIRNNGGASKEGQLFGGAYIIRPIVDGKKNARKVESIGELFDAMSRDPYLYTEIAGNPSPIDHDSSLSISPRKFAGLGSTTDSNEPGTMSYAFVRLMQFSGMGKFYNYQFIGDLAYTHVLRDAPDWFTWSFCGPGTSRGLVRLKSDNNKATLKNGKTLPRLMPLQRGWQEQLLELQKQVNKDLCGVTKPTPAQMKQLKSGQEVTKLVPIHMRNLTGCLCEFDKYERALWNERSIKRPYKGY